MVNRRSPDIVVISDVHLGTYGCHAAELNAYLKSVSPRILVLNGDIIDGWSFSKNYFPESHWKVLRRLIKMMNEGTRIFYLTGNHDEFLRRFAGVRLGKLKIDDKLLLEHAGKKYWFFHGDVFDVTMKHSKWLAKLGGKGYDWLILINRLVNRVLEKTGRERISLSKRIKNSVKQAVRFIDDFEQTAIDLALDDGLDYVICGHIHHPAIREVKKSSGTVIYMNSGDWIENLTALECEGDEWKIVHFEKSAVAAGKEQEGQEADEAIGRRGRMTARYETVPLILLNAELRKSHE
jgi:UDP-2,3-diacylglucosamine pyrophosphatase LpxH